MSISFHSFAIGKCKARVPSKKIASNGSNITPGLIIPILLFLYSCQCPGGCGYLVCQECYDLPMKMPSLHQQYECNVLANAIQNGNFVWGTFFGMMLIITLPSFKVCPRPNAPAKHLKNALSVFHFMLCTLYFSLMNALIYLWSLEHFVEYKF